MSYQTHSKAKELLKKHFDRTRAGAEDAPYCVVLAYALGTALTSKDDEFRGIALDFIRKCKEAAHKPDFIENMVKNCGFGGEEVQLIFNADSLDAPEAGLMAALDQASIQKVAAEAVENALQEQVG